MPPLVTVLIPVAPYHMDVVDNAVASVKTQTIQCDLEAITDFNQYGAGIIRNRLSRVSTPFIVFLDADDTLEPTFVEDCLRVYEQGKYVYTSWYCNKVEVKPNLCVTHDEDYRSHLVTTLYPTAIFRALGGFDETLPAHEDVDFYLRSMASGICGVYLDKPLLNYSDNGMRSKLFNVSPDKKRIMDDVYLRNGGSKTIMACCGQPGSQAQVSPGEELPGDVKAQALWAGMRTEVGHATGRVYRGGNGSVLNVSPEDLAIMPMHFKQVQDLSGLAPTRDRVLKEAGLV